MENQNEQKQKPRVPTLGILAVLALALFALAPATNATLLSFLAHITGGSFNSTAAFSDGTFTATGTMVAGNQGFISGSVTNNGAATQHRTLTVLFSSGQALAFGSEVTEASAQVDAGSVVEFAPADCSAASATSFSCTTPAPVDFASGADNVNIGLTTAGNFDPAGNPISVTATVN